MTGPDVDQLILLLLRRKLLSASQVPQTSLFTEEVENAVKKFQASVFLPADGIVGYQTVLLLKAP